jgi:hypothetical protein
MAEFLSTGRVPLDIIISLDYLFRSAIAWTTASDHLGEMTEEFCRRTPRLAASFRNLFEQA